jgi:predicted DNA-binding ribbon-helix-helix protein
MKSLVIKRSIIVAGHKTSVSLEDPFWNALKAIAGGRNMTLSNLVGAIDDEREHGNLSSAIRLFVLSYYRDQLSPEAGRVRQNGQEHGLRGRIRRHDDQTHTPKPHTGLQGEGGIGRHQGPEHGG